MVVLNAVGRCVTVLDLSGSGRIQHTSHRRTEISDAARGNHQNGRQQLGVSSISFGEFNVFGTPCPVASVLPKPQFAGRTSAFCGCVFVFVWFSAANAWPTPPRKGTTQMRPFLYSRPQAPKDDLHKEGIISWNENRIHVHEMDGW